MNFVFKCYLQKLFSAIPKGERLNFIFQRYITNTLPISDEGLIGKLAVAKEHLNKFTKYVGSPDVQNVVYYEFGAGWELINPIALSLLGIKTLYCIDIRELIFPELLNNVISKLYSLKKRVPFSYSLFKEEIPLITRSNFKNILMKYFRIDYRAPMDARCTNFQGATVDFIVSDVTFEHIPKDDIFKILKECYRILKKGGIVSCKIDYRDHWAWFDRKISIYNFLKYSPYKWERYNPSLHYQNRLRHKDYIDIISQTEFKILEDNPIFPSKEEMGCIKDMKIDKFFLDRYTFDELAIKGTSIVLKK